MAKKNLYNLKLRHKQTQKNALLIFNHEKDFDHMGTNQMLTGKTIREKNLDHLK